MSELVNLRIDQHPLGNPQPGDFGIYRDIVNGVTKKFDFTPFITSSTDNFEWSSTEATANNYDIGDVVTYSGNWYQSAVNNNQSIPGVNSDWTLITKSPSGLVYWQAGVYVEDKVFVLSEHRDTGSPELYFLASVTRPYNSSNIATEEAAGDWISVTEITKHGVASDNESHSPVTLDFKGSVKRLFDVFVSIDEDDYPQWVLDNEYNAKEFSIYLEVNNSGRNQTFPTNFKLFANSGSVSGNEWTPEVDGFYFIQGFKVRTETDWLVIIQGPSGVVPTTNRNLVLNTNTTQTGNIGTGEDTLFSYSLPAGKLAVNNDSITITVSGTYANSMNDKRLRVKFGGTTIVNVNDTSTSDGTWRATVEIIRTGAATQKCNGIFLSSTSTNDTAFYTTASETLSGSITILVTGEATSNNDIVGEMFKVKFEASE